MNPHPAPYSRDSAKLIVFQKKVLNVFKIKKGNCIFKELFKLYLIVLLISFFPLLLLISAKNRTKVKKYLFELQNQAEYNTSKYKLYLIILQQLK